MLFVAAPLCPRALRWRRGPRCATPTARRTWVCSCPRGWSSLRRCCIARSSGTASMSVTTARPYHPPHRRRGHTTNYNLNYSYFAIYVSTSFIEIFLYSDNYNSHSVESHCWHKYLYRDYCIMRRDKIILVETLSNLCKIVFLCFLSHSYQLVSWSTCTQ